MDRLCQWQTYRKPGRRNRWTRTDQAQDLHKEIREQHYCNSSSDKCGTRMCWNSDRSHRWKHEYHTQPRPPQPPLIASFKNWKGYSKLVRALKRWKQTSARHEPELNTPGSSRQASPMMKGTRTKKRKANRMGYQEHRYAGSIYDTDALQSLRTQLANTRQL